MKRTVRFIDADRNLAKLDVEITTRNGYPEFTASGDYQGGRGQIIDHIKPATEEQEKLCNLWEQWHLNGMSAGTPEQDAIVKAPVEYEQLIKGEQLRKFILQEYIDAETVKVRNSMFLVEDKINREKKGTKTDEEIRAGVEDYLATQQAKDLILNDVSIQSYAKYIEIREMAEEIVNGKIKYAYDAACYLLKITGKYIVEHPATGEDFKYGNGWYKKDLPENFEEELIELLEAIDEEMEGGTPVDDDHGDLFKDFDEPETCHALAIMLELNIEDIDDIEENGDNRYTVQGVDYLAGDDDEMDQEWDASLDSYLEECVYPELPGNMENYFDDDKWKREARMDGRAHSLNRYDGGELNEGNHYAYRQ